MIDLVIPTIRGREESLARCVDSYVTRAEGSVKPIVVRDSKTCGYGWARGLERGSAGVVLFACDDQEAVAEGWDTAALQTVSEGYVACPRVWTPDGRIESNGGSMAEPHHLVRRPQAHGTLVDYTTVPLLSRELALEVGMLADCHYATDVWVSYRARQLGVETALCHGFEVVHHQEQVGRGAGMEQGARDEMDVRRMREELSRCESLSPVR